MSTSISLQFPLRKAECEFKQALEGCVARSMCGVFIPWLFRLWAWPAHTRYPFWSVCPAIRLTEGRLCVERYSSPRIISATLGHSIKRPYTGAHT